MLYDYETCPHRVTLDLFGDPLERDPVSDFVQMLWERGHAFELETIEQLGVPFKNLRQVPRAYREGRTTEAILDGAPLIYGGRISKDDLLGEPDLLRHTEMGYVPVDIKSGAGLEGMSEERAGKPKKHYALQLALYSDILQRKGWTRSTQAFIKDVHGDEIPYDLACPRGPRTPHTMWEEYEDVLESVTAISCQTLRTNPALVSACSLCPWRSHCRRQMNQADDLTLIPELGRRKRDAFPQELQSVRALADAKIDGLVREGRSLIKGIGVGVLEKLHARAVSLKQQDARPYYTQAVDLPISRIELFFDVETDPFRDLCYLHGFVKRVRGDNTTEEFIPFTAEEAAKALEEKAFLGAWEFVQSHPEAIVYYYSPYERTTWKKLAQRFPDVASEDAVVALFEQDRFIDLYHDVVRSKMIWPTHSLSIKALASYLGFQWRDTDPSGAASVQWFHRWTETGDPAIWKRILEYNEDDCRAMRVLVDAVRQL